LNKKDLKNITNIKQSVEIIDNTSFSYVELTLNSSLKYSEKSLGDKIRSISSAPPTIIFPTATSNFSNIWNFSPFLNHRVADFCPSNTRE